MPGLVVRDLGRQPYRPVLELQRRLARDRAEGLEPDDLLLLVEHDPVITLGRSTAPTSLLHPRETLAAMGFDVVEVERGGDVTMHGPGQLVGYPIVDLQRLRPDLHWYLRTLEQALIGALARLGLEGRAVPGKTGVWVGPRKIASIGIHVRKWVTFHGFALNVTTNLHHFGAIVPCGLDGVEMTSVAAELGSRAPAAALWRATGEAVVAAMQEALTHSSAPR